MASSQQHVTFENRGTSIAGILHVPEGFDESGSYAAITVATPGSSVKEQIGAIYGERLAARGFLVLTFDPSYQGESGGEPRDLEDPAVRVEDIRCAVDHLMTLPFVDEERVGLLGICAGGGYAVNAALTDHRFKAIGTVVPVDIGRALRDALSPAGVLGTLEAVGAERTVEARSGTQRRDPWIPDDLTAAQAAGITDPDVLAAVAFYREGPFRHERSSNRLFFGSFGPLLGFDAFRLVPDLLTRPLQVVVGGRRGSTGSFEDGERLFDAAPGEKEFFVIEGAGHYDLYHVPAYVDQAIAHLAPFYARHLAAERVRS